MISGNVVLSFRSESPAIPSPHHLSWLALDTYKTFFPEETVSRLFCCCSFFPFYLLSGLLL